MSAPGGGRSGAWVACVGRSVRDAPTTVPALGAVALFVAWASSDGGYPLTQWAPGGLIVIALCAIAIGTVGLGLAGTSRAVRVALAALALYAAWSFISIIWANVPGEAWAGADRTLLYLLVFLLFAGWRGRGSSATILLVVWTLAMAGLALYVTVRLDGMSPQAIAAAFPGGRLVYPAGYVNAAAAQWMMAAWPAALLARSRELPAGIRGLLAASAVALAGLSLLSLSRGALLASAVLAVLVFALVPGRVRTFMALVPIALGVAITVPLLLKVGDRLEATPTTQANVAAGRTALHTATVTMFVAALVVGLVVGAAAQLDRGSWLAGSRRLRARRASTAVATLALLAAVGGGLAATGNPVSRVRHAWDTFKSPKGYEANGKGANRLLGGLGSNRYDFYRVALDEFSAHPLLGLGAENYAEAYLAHGHSDETPRYPHSVELRTLTETGIVGAVIALVGFACALLAAARAMYRAPAGLDRLAATTATAALSGFAYWVLHGSADWFWEYAGLGAPAFALLGMACSLDPAGARSAAPARRSSSERGGPGRARLGIVVLAVCVVLAAAASLAAPWLSALEVRAAAAVWAHAPGTAYRRLSDAAQLDPLSAEPALVAGSIALRLGDLKRADHQFALALQRSPDEQYATLERGAIASQLGEARRARAMLQRAHTLYPRDPLANMALALADAGRRVSVAALDRAILAKAQSLE
ncbi:MAG: O-antigen ligase family protein [Solirubrobacteraceae bacterium]